MATAESMEMAHVKRMEALGELDRQERVVHEAGSGHIERLLELFDGTVSDLKKTFWSISDQQRAQTSSEAEEIREQHQTAVSLAKAATGEVWAAELDRSVLETQAYETERESIRNRNLETIHMLKVTTNIVIEKLEGRFDDVHKAYVELTEERNQEFLALGDADRSMSAQIERQVVTIERVAGSILHWRKALARSTVEGDASLAALQRQRDIMFASYQKLHGNFKQVRADNAAVLKQCSCLTRANLRKLGIAFDSCQRVLRIAAQLQVNKDDDDTVYPCRNGLDTTLDRISRARIDIVECHERRQRLVDENIRLKTLLATYMEGISISGSVVDGPNPLLIVNGRFNSRLTTRSARYHRPAIVDGCLMARTYALHTAAVQ